MISVKNRQINLSMTIALLAVLIGYIAGCVIVGFFGFVFADGTSFSDILSPSPAYTWGFVFCDGCLYGLLIFGLGLSLFGFAASYIVLFIKAFTVGIYACSCYTQYGFQGISVLLLALFPTAFLYLFALTVMCSCSAEMSYSALKSDNHEKLGVFVRSYCIECAVFLFLCFACGVWQKNITPLFLKYVCSLFL